MIKTEECYFSNIESKLINELLVAQSDVKVAQYFITNPNLLSILSYKANQGICVSLLFDFNKRNILNLLKYSCILDFGVKVFIPKKSKTIHHKFCVIDNNTIITGSYNWSKSSKRNEENIILSRNKKIIHKYEKEFLLLCSQSDLYISDKKQKMRF